MNISGTYTALITPFKGDTVDLPAFRALVEDQIQNGIAGLVPCGTTGETVNLSDEEQDEVVAETIAVAAGRVPVMMGVGSNSTRKTLESVDRARRLGVSSLLVVTPYYNKPTQEGMIRHFRAVAERAGDLPLCLYNVPGRTGVNLEPSTVEKLLSVPNIVAIKDATGSPTVATELRLRCGGRLSLLSGDDFTTLPFMALGGDGVISVASNVVPGPMARLVAAAGAGRLDEARRLHFDLYTLFGLLFVESNPIPVKAALAMMGRIEDALRLPLCPMSAGNREKLRAELARLKLLPAAQA